MFPRVLRSPGKAFPAYISLGMRVSLTFSFEVHVRIAMQLRIPGKIAITLLYSDLATTFDERHC